MKHLLLALLLLGCEVPKFEFETEGLPCSIPREIQHFKHPNTKGCWRVSSAPGHGVTTDDPGLVSCSEGVACIVTVDGEPFWTTGAGENVWTAEDVDCSEVCP